MEQRVPKTSCFVTTLHIDLILTLWVQFLLNPPDEIKHILVIRPYRDIRQNLIFFTELALRELSCGWHMVCSLYTDYIMKEPDRETGWLKKGRRCRESSETPGEGKTPS